MTTSNTSLVATVRRQVEAAVADVIDCELDADNPRLPHIYVDTDGEVSRSYGGGQDGIPADVYFRRVPYMFWCGVQPFDPWGECDIDPADDPARDSYLALVTAKVLAQYDEWVAAGNLVG